MSMEEEAVELAKVLYSGLHDRSKHWKDLAEGTQRQYILMAIAAIAVGYVKS